MATKDNARTYSNAITRERQKETGEIFTPQYLVDQMIDKLGESAMKLGYTIFEPAAGDGNFVARIIERKIQWNVANGVSLADAAKGAVSDVYACEYMKDNRDAIIRRIGDMLITMGLYSNKTEWSNSTIRSIARKRVAYCNTLDPWDKTDGREYPKWLMDAIPADKWEQLKKKSKHFKKTKADPKQPNLEFLF